MSVAVRPCEWCLGVLHRVVRSHGQRIVLRFVFVSAAVAVMFGSGYFLIDRNHVLSGICTSLRADVFLGSDGYYQFGFSHSSRGRFDCVLIVGRI